MLVQPVGAFSLAQLELPHSFDHAVASHILGAFLVLSVLRAPANMAVVLAVREHFLAGTHALALGDAVFLQQVALHGAGALERAMTEATASAALRLRREVRVPLKHTAQQRLDDGSNTSTPAVTTDHNI